jgi:hypothetical protein
VSRSYRPIEPARLPQQVATVLDAAPVPGRALRVAVDGPACAHPERFADSLISPLRALGRPARSIRTETFWRDAALRFEFGREDVESFAGWLDAAALRREVLDPFAPGGSGSYLPSLRDPVTNRATRAAAVAAEARGVVIVAGRFLLGGDLPFDHTVHLAVSAAARARQTEATTAWTLPAYERYDADRRPSDIADIVIRFDDPTHPAIAV